MTIRPMLAAAVLLLGLALWGHALAGTGSSCVDVRFGQQQYYNCINRRLEQATEGRRLSARDAPLGVNSPAPALGVYNRAATQETLGGAFGHGVVPERPHTMFQGPLVGLAGRH